jgi:hypothetical protein
MLTRGLDRNDPERDKVTARMPASLISAPKRLTRLRPEKDNGTNCF